MSREGLKEVNESIESKDKITLYIEGGFIIWYGYQLDGDLPEKYKLPLKLDKVEIDLSKGYMGKFFVKDKNGNKVAIINYALYKNKGQAYILLAIVPTMSDKKYGIIDKKIVQGKTEEICFRNNYSTSTYEKEVGDLCIRIKFN